MGYEKTIGDFVRNNFWALWAAEILYSHPLRFLTACPFFHVDLFVFTISWCPVSIFVWKIYRFCWLLLLPDISSVCTFGWSKSEIYSLRPFLAKVLGYLSTTKSILLIVISPLCQRILFFCLF